MDTIRNAALYLSKQPNDLARVLPHAKSDKGFFRKPTRVDFVLAGQSIRINIMPKAEIAQHLAGLAGYIHSLGTRGVNSAAEVQAAKALLPHVVAVLGVAFSKPIDFHSDETGMLFTLAHHYQGHVFMGDSLISPGMKVLCGPAEISLEGDEEAPSSSVPPSDLRIVGFWTSRDGNYRLTNEYRADGTVLQHMGGRSGAPNAFRIEGKFLICTVIQPDGSQSHDKVEFELAGDTLTFIDSPTSKRRFYRDKRA